MELKTEEMKREEMQSTFCCTKKGMVFLIKYISFEAYPLLAPKCRVVPGGVSVVSALSSPARYDMAYCSGSGSH